jgi:hypothetical protein
LSNFHIFLTYSLDLFHDGICLSLDLLCVNQSSVEVDHHRVVVTEDLPSHVLSPHVGSFTLRPLLVLQTDISLRNMALGCEIVRIIFKKRFCVFEALIS